MALSKKREDEEKTSLLEKKRITDNEFVAEFKTAEGGTYTIRVIKERSKSQRENRIRQLSC